MPVPFLAVRSRLALCRPLALVVPLTLAMPLTAAEPKPFAEMALKVGEVLESDYYDRARFQPKLMVERALRRLAQAEISICPRWAEGRITLIIGADTVAIPAPDPQDLGQAMTLLEQVRRKLEDGRFKADRGRELSYALLNGAVSVLDPHTELSPPEIAEMFRTDMAGQFYGIGAFIREDEGMIYIERVIAGTPAERAGIEDGDMILAVNGEKTAGLTREQAVTRIRGPKGTTVVMTVERKGAAGTLDIPVVRDLVQSVTVRSWHNRKDVAYIRLDEFSALANIELRKHYADLTSAGAFKVLVLDMRFNGGGLLDQAKLICANFLADQAEIVRTVTVDGRPSIHKSRMRAEIDVPVVMLVSPGTASAAEIVAGALQRNDRGVVAGRVTFGKGTVQTLRDLDDDSRLRLTIQEYQLPGGVSIQDVGVTPDLSLVERRVYEDRRVDLRPPTFRREGDYEFALANRQIYRHQPTYELGWLSRYQTKEEMRRSFIASRDFIPDQEAALVIDLVQQCAADPGFNAAAAKALKERRSRQWLLEQLKQPVQERAEREAAALAEALTRQPRPVIWGGATPIAPESLVLAYTGPAQAEAGAKVGLTFTVTNRAASEVGRLYAVLKADKSSPLWEDETAVGGIAAGATASVEMPFAVPPRAYSGEERFAIELFHDGRKEPVASLPVVLAVKGGPRPHLGFEWTIEEADASRDNKLDADEKDANLVVTLANDGAAPTGDLEVGIFKDNDQYLELGQSREKLQVLVPGRTQVVKVPILVRKQITAGGKTTTFAGEAVKVQLLVQERLGKDVDSRYRAGLAHTITIPVGAPLVPRRVQVPQLELEGVDKLGGNRATVRVRVTDNNLRYVGCFIDEDKVDLRAVKELGLKPIEGRPGLEGGVYTVTLSLKGGVNNVHIFAVDQDEADQSLPLRLWGEGKAVERKEQAGDVP